LATSHFSTSRAISVTQGDTTPTSDVDYDSGTGNPIIDNDSLLNKVLSWWTETPRGSDATSTKPTVEVLVQVDGNTGELYFDINGMYSPEGELYTDGYYNEDEDELPLNAEEATPSLVLDEENSSVIYSDGTYAPVTLNGVQYNGDDDPHYVYTVEYYLDGMPVAVTENISDLSEENLLGRILSSFLGTNNAFGPEDVYATTRALIDPDDTIVSDEYYEYRIYLHSGTVRETRVMQYTSYRDLTESFAEIGFVGDPLLLIAASTEIPPPSRSSGIVDVLKNIGLSVIDLFRGDESNDGQPVVTDLGAITSASGEITMDDINSVTVIFDVEAVCPPVFGLDRPYLYEIMLASKAVPGADTDQAFRAVRCGGGTEDAYVEQIASHFESFDGVGQLDRQTLRDLIRFASFKDLNWENLLAQMETDTETEVSEPAATSSTPAITEDPEKNFLPNLTNDVVFEVKAVSANGDVISDWSQPEEVSITSGVQLHFRWDGTDYQQCLPFLNDNGNYSLMVKNRAMTTGNTESEGYNIAERSAVYRIECGGQRNNEFGVDAREIKVELE
jgi:hypothetical protein